MYALFAQAGNNQNNGPPPELLIVLLVIVGGMLLVGLVIAIFFFLTLSKALTRCHPRNRTMEPGMVWLNFIPLFNIVWQFITVNRVAESLSNEFYERGWDRPGEDYGKSIGTTYCIMNVLGCIPYCGAIFAIIRLVCFIIYWVKIANYSGQLASRTTITTTGTTLATTIATIEGSSRLARGPPRDETDDGYEDRPWERADGAETEAFHFEQSDCRAFVFREIK